MILVDSNVLIDVLNVDQQWASWSRSMLDRLNDEGEELAINTVVLAEIASNFASLADGEQALDSLDIEVLQISNDAAFRAGQAFRLYRRRQQSREAILSDFLIGAHALTIGAALLTRDVALYASYFPDPTLITRETQP